MRVEFLNKEEGPIVFNDKEELAKELALMDFEIADFPDGGFYLYKDGSLYNTNRKMVWDEADQRHTWFKPDLWYELWEKASAS